jgi:hypothetical protein
MKRENLSLHEIVTYVNSSPLREFNTGVKARGLFSCELEENNINKASMKKLVKKGIFSKAHINFGKKGVMAFYALRDLPIIG